MISLAHPDDVLIAPPRRTVVWEGEERIRIWRWSWWRRVRRVWTLRALPAFPDLDELERTLDTVGRIDYRERIAAIAAAHGLQGILVAPIEVLLEVERAHYETNYPKARAEAESRSAAAPSSAASPPGTATPSSTSPA